MTVIPDTTLSTSPLFRDAYLALVDVKKSHRGERVASVEDGILLAMGASLRADCVRRQVAAVVTTFDGFHIGTGRNGSPAGYPGCLTDGACPRGRLSYDQVAPGASYSDGAGKCISLHAEENALSLTSRRERLGGSIFITDAPCDRCSLMIAGSGLANAYWPVVNDGVLVDIVHRVIAPGQPIGGLYAGS